MTKKYSYAEYCLMGAAGILVYAPMKALKYTGLAITGPFYLVGKALKENDEYCKDK